MKSSFCFLAVKNQSTSLHLSYEWLELLKSYIRRLKIGFYTEMVEASISKNDKHGYLVVNGLTQQV